MRPCRALPSGTLESFGRFIDAARSRQCEKVLAVATSAVREAENGGDLIERAKAELKLPIRVVSAKEEARLIYLGVRHAPLQTNDVPKAATPFSVRGITLGEGEKVISMSDRVRSCSRNSEPSTRWKRRTQPIS